MRATQEVIVAEYQNKFITWISDGHLSRVVGDDEWVRKAISSSQNGNVVELFDGSFSYGANIFDVDDKVAVFAGLASYPLDEIKIRECPEGFKLEIKDAIRTDFFAEMLGKELSDDEWEDFLNMSTVETDAETRWEHKGRNLKELLQKYINKHHQTVDETDEEENQYG